MSKDNHDCRSETAHLEHHVQLLALAQVLNTFAMTIAMAVWNKSETVSQLAELQTAIEVLLIFQTIFFVLLTALMASPAYTLLSQSDDRE